MLFRANFTFEFDATSSMHALGGREFAKFSEIN
jgi:hypothetical protein